MASSETPPGKLPLYVRNLLAVALAVALAVLARRLGAADERGDLRHAIDAASPLGLLVIRLLKALAGPLILCAVVDAFARTEIPPRQAARLFGLSTLNALVALALGLGVAHVFRAGRLWSATLREAQAHATRAGHVHAAASNAAEAAPTLSPLANLQRYVPENVVEPFAKNNVISIVLLAVLLGASLRAARRSQDPSVREAVRLLASLAHGGLAVCSRALGYVVELIPVAVFAVVLGVVVRSGLGVFRALGPFLAIVLLGLGLQAFVWYGLLVRVVGGRSPRAFFAGAMDAVVTALSCSSSLATLPVTLRCLQDRLGVSAASSRLAACVGTNLNHDGIILYEATAALFVSQALGTRLDLGQQASVALASVMAGVGIAGVPEAGLITLPLVLAAAGVPDTVCLVVVPLLLPIDWVLGRCRAATNVLSDMTVAVLLDRFEGLPPSAREGPTGTVVV
ncbi:MAG: dicarboxylate/amino acid:cation symporter [Deltaproteobacteria bacterium]|nr:dicarboxylate/amino acid:cation symporter [Deltaproteobacteria bacterium]